MDAFVEARLLINGLFFALKFVDTPFFPAHNLFKFMTTVIYSILFTRVTCTLSRVDFTEHSAKIIVK